MLTRAILLPPTSPESRNTTAVPVRLIPDSLDEETESAFTSLEGDGNGGIDLTAAEREALRVSEVDEIARRNLPGRVITHPLPHPNEVFFLKVSYYLFVRQDYFCTLIMLASLILPV